MSMAAAAVLVVVATIPIVVVVANASHGRRDPVAVRYGTPKMARTPVTGPIVPCKG